MVMAYFYEYTDEAYEENKVNEYKVKKYEIDFFHGKEFEKISIASEIVL